MTRARVQSLALRLAFVFVGLLFSASRCTTRTTPQATMEWPTFTVRRSSSSRLASVRRSSAFLTFPSCSLSHCGLVLEPARARSSSTRLIRRWKWPLNS